MSLKALVWALEEAEVFCASQKFTLVALANYCSETGKSWPAVATICRLTQLSDDTVRRCLRQLEEDCVITDTGKRFGPTQQVKVWQLPEAAWKLNARLKVPDEDPHDAGLVSGKDPLKTRGRPAKDPQGAGQTLEPVNRKPKEEGANAPIAASKKFSDGWIKAFQAKFGIRYDYGKLDGVSADRLLKRGVSPDEMIAVATKAWAQTDSKKAWNCVNMSGNVMKFCSKYNDIRFELAKLNGHAEKPQIAV